MGASANSGDEGGTDRTDDCGTPSRGADDCGGDSIDAGLGEPDGEGDRVETVLSAASDLLRVERRRVADEREAFEVFRRQIVGIAASDASLSASEFTRHARFASGPSTTTGGGSPRIPGNGLVAVRDEYTATVMSVPHYEAEYDDTYEASLAAEFGPELAVALTQESTLHPRYKASLIAEVDGAIAERDRFLEALDAERDSIDRAASRLLAVAEEMATLSRTEFSDAPFGTLDAHRARVDVLREECEAIAVRRQEALTSHGESLRLDDGVPDLSAYLYDDLSVAYPVLATVATVVDRLDGIQDSVARAVAERAN